MTRATRHLRHTEKARRFNRRRAPRTDGRRPRRTEVNGRVTARSGRDLEQVTFTASDRRWILDTLGSRADVQALWATVCEQQPLALAA